MSSEQQREYTVKHPVNVTFHYTTEYVGLAYIRSIYSAENRLLSEDGPYCCWDAGVSFDGEKYVCEGNTEPSGGGIPMILTIPVGLIKEIDFEKTI